jgi:hypothetical protein
MNNINLDLKRSNSEPKLDNKLKDGIDLEDAKFEDLTRR